jgi:uncharacterized protein (TIGR02001 family)
MRAQIQPDKLIRQCAVALVAALCGSSPAPTAAAVGTSISLTSDDWFRGRSLSNGRPVAGLDLSYDDSSGIYLGGTATGVATAHSGLRLLGSQQNIGYATRTKADPVLDVGIVNSIFTRYFSGRRAAHYTEAYFGVVTRHLSSHVYYSPRYLQRGISTLYGELDGVIEISPTWRLNGHFGVLRQLGDTPPPPRSHYDWRAGITTQFRNFEFQLAVVGGGSSPNFYARQSQNSSAVVVGISRIF